MMEWRDHLIKYFSNRDNCCKVENYQKTKPDAINYKEFDSAIKHLNNYHFPVSIKNYFTIKKINQIISFMMRDKKNNSKNIKLMLIKRIGGPIIEKEISDVTVKLFLKKRLIN